MALVNISSYTKLLNIGLMCLLLFSFSSINGQSCGTLSVSPPSSYRDAIAKTHDSRLKSNEVDTVALTFHIVEATSGNPRISYEALAREIISLNTFFRLTNIHFISCGSPRITTGMPSYNFSNSDNLHRSNRVPASINVYWVDELTSNEGDPLCGFAFFPWTASDQERYIMMDKLCIGDGKVLAHELGHYFGLYHTHETAFGRELADGSNCLTSGDLICDTGADPLVGTNNIDRCEYIGQEVDARGQKYNPPVENLMSYAPNGCQRSFSPQQIDIMRFNLSAYNEFAINSCSYFPDLSIASISQAFTVTSGTRVSIRALVNTLNFANNQNIDLYVILEGENGTSFIIERSSIISSTALPSQNVVLNTTIPLSTTSGNYNLRIVLDPNSAFLEQSELNNEAIIQLTIDNSMFPDIAVLGQPVQNELNIFLRDQRRNGKLTMVLSDIMGRTYTEIGGFKNGSEFQALIDVSSLPKGVNFLTVWFENSNFKESFCFLKL